MNKYCDGNKDMEACEVHSSDHKEYVIKNGSTKELLPKEKVQPSQAVQGEGTFWAGNNSIQRHRDCGNTSCSVNEL